VIAAKAVEFIESAHGQPFFLHVGFHAPHTEGPNLPLPAPRHFGSLRGIPPWRPESWDEPDISDKPPWIFDFPRASQPIGAFLTYGTYTDAMRRYQLETLLALDEAIAAIRRAVDATGQAENTVIVFSSDNGYLWGEHRIWSVKDYPYEESVRIPLIVRFPRLIREPREDAHPVLNIDLPPTLASLARARPTSAVDGRSFAPLLDGETPWRSDFALEWWNGGEGFTSYAGVRSESFKYVNYENGGVFELYDLAADPLEQENLSGDSSRRETLDALQARLESLLAGNP
jgi:N-acetylglucosamine-6-sulfatase